ncbi:Tetratricopeptide repeat-containing protein [Halopseudomonas xinjiangensis]|uniref:Tetratricopeptide repeat-containing protein n=1 Tax=Halopseudomonas xinjiangensis TaxID=487184 RepID=A0A1H1WM95_9GAMM|nr:tetratricopeptide repeat protein [Halopseudomonas xinjiangensis]SDS98438.1 Tetratricopeptide repeat-containing protein [Halopseudomonas xinjiangensis]
MTPRILSAGLLSLVVCCGAVQAQQQISRPVFEAIAEAQRLQQAGSQAEARARLEAIRQGLREGSLELALVHQRLGYLAIEQDRPSEAIKWLRLGLNSGALGDQAAAQDRRNLAQLLIGAGQHAEAVRLLEQEQQRGELSTPRKRLLVQAYSELEQYDKAIPLAEQVVAADPQADTVWYRLLAGMNHRLERYRQAERWLKVLVRRQPNQSEHWRQLAGMQSLDERQVEAAATLRLAHEGGISLSDQDLHNLVAVHVQAGAPWQAARLLQALLAENLLRPSAERQRLLAQLWSQARDRERAEAAWSALAGKSGASSDWLQLARLQLEKQQWSALLGTLERAEAGASAEQLATIRQWRDYVEAVRAEEGANQ